MGPFILSAALLLVLQAAYTRCETIDEMISSAQKAADDMRSMVIDNESDTVIIELDMKFKRSTWDQMKRAVDGHRKKRKAIRPGIHRWIDQDIQIERWTNNEIPYYINQGFSAEDRHQIRLAMRHWQSMTCLTFKRKTSRDVNYINIVGGEGCSSMVGMTGGSQPLTLETGCRAKHIIVHELGHAIGFLHEHSRPDRDEFVSIYNENIKADYRNQFNKYRNAIVNTYNVTYDYLSIMHYGAYFSSQRGCRTIVTNNPDYQFRIGRSKELSFKDIKLANLMYTCNSHCERRTCPDNGFHGKDCKCYCEGNPIRDCDSSDEEVDENLDQYTLNDTKRNCEKWAASGECEMNPQYMITHCQKSCDTCTYQSSEESTMSLLKQALREPEAGAAERNSSTEAENKSPDHTNSTSNSSSANSNGTDTSQEKSDTGSSEPNTSTYQQETSSNRMGTSTIKGTSQPTIISTTESTGSILLDAITSTSIS